jgi:hypothetical protein
MMISQQAYLQNNEGDALVPLGPNFAVPFEEGAQLERRHD